MNEEPQPGPPPKEALDYFRAKGWKPGFDYRDVWREEHATAFTVAKAMELDVLMDIREEVDRALAEGRTFEQFKQGLRPRLEKRGWWGVQDRVDPKTGETRRVQLGSPRRLQTIYRANVRTALAAGQWQRAQRTKRALPYFVYGLGPSERHRPEHAALAGLILPVDDPFWDTHYPPNGWNCKCHLRQITRREADRNGGPGESPEVERIPWVNQRTGQTEMVPRGIDPGWDTNPGKARSQAAVQSLGHKAEASEGSIANAVIRANLRAPGFADWLKSPRGNQPVAALDDEAMRLIDAQQRVVWLSGNSMAKQAKAHPELTADEYRLLPDVIEQGEIILQTDQKLVYFRQEEQLYKAVVKSTADGMENYLVSFHRADEREKARETNRGQRVR